MLTNHISVVHRYFIDAEPEPLDWQYLTVEQSAADHHRIVTLFKQIYSSVWISSGRSKGGETVLFHHRFYPDDVDATIAYVAPLLFGTADPRFIDFLGSLGSEECGNKIHEFQQRCLSNRDSLATRLIQWFPDNGYTFSGDADMTLESSVRSYDWLQTQGNNIIYIYGGADPWTGGAVELSGQTNAIKIIQAGADHGVKIVDLDRQQLVYSTLEQWLGIEIGTVAKRLIPIEHLEKKELIVY